MNTLVDLNVRLRTAVERISEVANRIDEGNVDVDVAEIMENVAIAAVVLMDVSTVCAELADCNAMDSVA